jgi:hypothetical protein
MPLGTDYFLSHHIYVANSRRRLCFTYHAAPASAGSEPIRL